MRLSGGEGRTRAAASPARVDPDAPYAPTLDRAALIRAALAADPRVAYVARVRGRELFFSNGGTEIELAARARSAS
jgi:hypothetical protein